MGPHIGVVTGIRVNMAVTVMEVFGAGFIALHHDSDQSLDSHRAERMI